MHHCYTGLNTHHFTALVIAYQLIGRLLTSMVFCADTVRFQHMVPLRKYWELSVGYGLATVFNRGGVLEDVLGLEDVLKDTF